jgi:uncharacterized membrane protein YccC
MDENQEFQALIKERFAQLPPVVQRAIVSADVKKRLQAMADESKLHIDQWQDLENEVQLTLLGVLPAEDLEKNIRESVRVSADVARSLATEITTAVFEPVRQELERQLQHPDAVAKQESAVEEVREKILAQDEGSATSSATAVPIPMTTPASASTPTAPVQPEPQQQSAPRVVRAPISETYKPGTVSTGRKAVHDDPYRESPL